MLEQDSQKNEMETGDENCIFTGREIGNESRMNSARNTKPTELWEDQRKDGKMKSMTSSDRKEPKMR